MMQTDAGRLGQVSVDGFVLSTSSYSRTFLISLADWKGTITWWLQQRMASPIRTKTCTTAWVSRDVVKPGSRWTGGYGSELLPEVTGELWYLTRLEWYRTTSLLPCN